MGRAGLLKSAILWAVLLAAGSISAQSNLNARIIPNKGVTTTDNAVFDFKNASQGATKYSWITGDGAVIDNTNDLSWEYSDMGFYRVGLIAYNDVTADTTYVQVAVLRGQNNGNVILDPTANQPIPAISYSEDEK